MTANVRTVIERVLLHEGGVADVGDGKGETRWGQTPDWLATWGLASPVNAEHAADNYAVWLDRIGLSDVCDFDPVLGGAVVDWAVHSGQFTAFKGLQKALGVAVDGKLGPVTKHHLFALDAAGRKHAVLNLHCARLEFIGRLITDAPDKHAKFAAGWCNRLAANIRQDCA